jgi:hypothetical protein
MGIRMKATLEIPEGLMRELEARAAREGKTTSELVEIALRMLLDERPPEGKLPPLPTWDSGGFLVNIDSRAKILDPLDDESDDVEGGEG